MSKPVNETTYFCRKSISPYAKDRFDNTNERRCQLIFDREDISIPTALIVLPYKLQLDQRKGTLVVPSAGDMSVAVKIGECLLEINRATARLFFWLQLHSCLSDSNGDRFREDVRDWLVRARTESTDGIADEIMGRLEDCEPEYFEVCREVLEKDTAHSNAVAYIKDPMNAAHEEFQRCTKRLLKLYKSTKGCSFVYLLDELRHTPICKQDQQAGTSYPLRVRPKKIELIERIFLPFMNLSAMSAMAESGLSGLAKLLGLPSSYEIPPSWAEASVGLVHRINNKNDSVATFSSLQQMVRERCGAKHEDTDQALEKSQKKDSRKSKKNSLSLLKRFYREHDPSNCFSDLTRVSDGRSAAWTTEEEVERMKDEGKLFKKPDNPLSFRMLSKSLQLTSSICEQKEKISSGASIMSLSSSKSSKSSNNKSSKSSEKSSSGSSSKSISKSSSSSSRKSSRVSSTSSTSAKSTTSSSSSLRRRKKTTDSSSSKVTIETASTASSSRDSSESKRKHRTRSQHGQSHGHIKIPRMISILPPCP